MVVAGNFCHSLPSHSLLLSCVKYFEDGGGNNYKFLGEGKEGWGLEYEIRFSWGKKYI